MKNFTIDDLRQNLSAHIPLYSWHPPAYQYVVLKSVQSLWDASHRSALDVGGGTGVIAQAVKSIFCLERVASVDVEDRFLPSIDVDTTLFDGVNLPFADGSFDCILMFNVLHHVPVNSRLALLRECRRVAGEGPIYIKDHVSTSIIDDVRLSVLDLLGNIPFHGMLTANYLAKQEWLSIARESGYYSAAELSGGYRSGIFEVIFPNRIEICMKWRPI